MNPVDIIICILVVIAVIIAIFVMVRDKKRGKNPLGCGGSCESCGMKETCEKK